MQRLKKFLANKFSAPVLSADRERGFTLLEVIIALAIMVMAFASILSVESGAIRASEKTRQLNVIAMLAKNKMVETEYAIEGKSFEEVKKEESGTFEAPYDSYRWKKVIKEIEFPNLALSSSAGGDGKSAGSASEGGGFADTMTKLVSKFFSKAIREVTITIFWKQGSGEQTFSLSTYWVDLEHEFALSE